MIKPVFHIVESTAEAEDFSQCRLLLEVNANSLSYVLLQLKGMRPMVVKFYQWNQFKTEPLEEVLDEIIQEDPFLNIQPQETFLIYNFKESNLVPERLFVMDSYKELVDLVHGDLDQNLVLREKIPWWDFHNVYRVPLEAHRLLQKKFSAGRYWHFYSLQMKCHKMFHVREEPQFGKVFFYPDKIVVMLLKEGKLLLLQSFPYQDARDVTYILLNACQELGLHPEIIHWELTGLVDQESTLYQELQKYFLKISFDPIEDTLRIGDALLEFPRHYFSSLLKMAICV